MALTPRARHAVVPAVVVGGIPAANGRDVPGRNRSSQPGGSSGRNALRIRHIHGMEVREKRLRGFK